MKGRNSLNPTADSRSINVHEAWQCPWAEQRTRAKNSPAKRMRRCWLKSSFGATLHVFQSFMYIFHIFDFQHLSHNIWICDECNVSANTAVKPLWQNHWSDWSRPTTLGSDSRITRRGISSDNIQQKYSPWSASTRPLTCVFCQERAGAHTRSETHLTS